MMSRHILHSEPEAASFLVCTSRQRVARLARAHLLLSEGSPMANVPQTEPPHIVRVEGVCGGEPLIDGLRVTVRHVATLHQRGETILEIAESLGLTEAQVFHALSYFCDHRDEIAALIAQEEQAHARFTRP